MKKLLRNSLILCSLFLAQYGAKAQNLTLIHYWDFNTLSNCGVGGINASPIAPEYSVFPAPSNANLVLVKGTAANYKDSIVDSATGGFFLNERNSATGDDSTTGNCGKGNLLIKYRNPSKDNQFLWYLPTTGYHNIVVSFATNRSGSGPLAQVYDYSLDSGKTFTHANMTGSTGSLMDTLLLPAANLTLVKLDFSGIKAVNNNGGFVLRVESAGGNSQDTINHGNSQYDNIAVEGLVGPNGIEPIANELSCNLYPNPATDFISIATPFEGNKVVTVYNAVGQAVKYTITNGTQFSVNTEELSKGFYFVNVREQNGLKTSILKFVKN